MPQNAELHEQDFYAWTQSTAALIREGKWYDLAPEVLAEEVESLGKRDRRELGSRLQTLLLHLLKWGYQPTERSGSWRGTIRRERREIAGLLEQSPSLTRFVAEDVTRGYLSACEEASDDTGLPVALFPRTCTWTVGQILDAAFWPDA